MQTARRGCAAILPALFSPMYCDEYRAIMSQLLGTPSLVQCDASNNDVYKYTDYDGTFYTDQSMLDRGVIPPPPRLLSLSLSLRSDTIWTTTVGKFVRLE